MNNRFLLISFFTVILFSCKKLPVTDSSADQQEIDNFMVEEIQFNYLTAKAKLNYKDSENDHNLTANIRIKKDSVIWISVVPLLGIEASRCLITKDSVFVLDRIKNQYFEYDFKSLEKQINIRLSYEVLESMLLGNLPYPKKHEDHLSLLPNKEYYLLVQSRGNLNIENYIRLNSMKLERVQIKETQKELDIVYNNFAPLDTFSFAFNSLVNLTYPFDGGIQSTKISIQYTKIELPDKPLNFPFNVPAKYTRKE